MQLNTAAFKNKFKVYSDAQNLPQSKFKVRNCFPSMKIIFGPLKQ